MTEAGPPGPSDLGRRVAELRQRSHLSVEEAAQRAGMAPSYLEFLESSPTPNPSQATIMRLAAGLDADTAELTGAWMTSPPGERAATPNPVLHTLSESECRARIAPGGVGRFLFVEPGRGPVAIPVNYRLDSTDVIFRTGPAATVLAGLREKKVSFDVDHLDEALSEGWSVLLTGTARRITDEAELDHVGQLGIQPWAGGEKPVYVRLVPTEITGRAIRVSG